MRIGLILEPTEMMASVKHVFRTAADVLKKKHEIVHRPAEYAFAGKKEAGPINKQYLLDCDLVLGYVDRPLLEAREQIDKHVPYAAFLLGNMSRGAPNLATSFLNLRTTDLLIGNCTADLEIAKNFFSNARMRLLPFSFDESSFYPSDEGFRKSVRAQLGLSEKDKVIVYVGRLTLEKNVQTLLKIFRILQDKFSDVHLLVTGGPHSYPFYEFGIYPLDFAATLSRLVEKLGLDKARVRFLPQTDAQRLRTIYTIADVMVNMTLHHDENFGYAQVEAMACGTPVVGTSWGGLKDSIVEGETGYQVSTAVTETGVKVDWWEAANKIAMLLGSGAAREDFRSRCQRYALENYSLTRYADLLESIVADCDPADGIGARFDLTDFGQQFWQVCGARHNARPPYRRGERATELYKELIRPFTGQTRSSVPVEEALDATHVLLLAAPVTLDSEGMAQIDDPIFPLVIKIIEKHREIVVAVLHAMQREPVITIARLKGSYLQKFEDCSDALIWMQRAGLVLRTRTEDWPIGPRTIARHMSDPVFSIQNVSYTTDVVVIN